MANGEVEIAYEENGLRVTVNDSGSGYSGEVNVTQLEAAGKFGLLGMTERAAEVHASIAFGRSTLGGARITFYWENGEMS
jgi:signal transduction histidine kinase